MTERSPICPAQNQCPPQAAGSLFVGKVMHHRMKPREHRFTYSVFNVLLDLDRLDEADKASPVFSVEGFNLFSFSAKDHGLRDGSSLRAHVDGLLAKEGFKAPARVLLLAYPRVLGYVFNPLSVYYCHDETGDLNAIIYEVRNTFGDLHTYVRPVRAGEKSDAGVRQVQRKAFYVSPFLDMNQTYHFRMLPPREEVRVRILETDGDGPILAATFSGTQKPFKTSQFLKLFFSIPLLTLKVMAAIHWEALKLWRKRIKFHSRAKSVSGQVQPENTPNSQIMTG